ncbi:TlpA family protein disulfide reductase [Rhodohalobacter mucosus]|uniref:Thioredoxin domain-containing protein n=1 Tax=Rhodohalobacter mucosus TaxID=2079485 RepID=A0A316TW42_9BACT|nr:hypothetical protein [Rhodohalobacter mucosus]PWN07589.1 hypothetical protein DDZ15_04855 [Rhodohalobacter mucosus]
MLNNTYVKSGAVLTVAALVVLLAGCSFQSDESVNNAFISGRVTVDEELDNSGDNSGIELLITAPSSLQQGADTLFHATTDSSGFFEGTARFDEPEVYRMVVLRNNNVFGFQGLVLADGDTITYTATLPDIGSTSDLKSKENEIFRDLERVDRNFNRVAQFINAGAIPADSIEFEINKWSDIYWDVHERYPGTYASMVAGNSSVAVAGGWNDSLMVERANRLLETEGFLRRASRAALAEYYAETAGIERVLQFYDRLENLAKSENRLMEIQIDRIELLYDSSMTVEANRFLQQFTDNYSDNEIAMEWAENKSYDLEFLTPGTPFPEFSFLTLTDDSISSSMLEDSPYLLEITRLDNNLYQQQYDRTVAIHQIYSNFGLKIITVPLAASDVAMNAFYEERGLLWSVIEPDSFQADSLIERYNINQVPTRFLVNDKGELVRRYVGNEYDDVVRGLQSIITQNSE